MATCSSISGYAKRIPYYSTPEVSYSGDKVGDAATNFNAKVMRGAACRVANYRTTDLPDVNIGGASKVCPGEGVTLTGDIMGLPQSGPFRFEWSISYDGGLTFGTPTVVTSGSTVNILQVINGLDEQGDVVVVRLVAGLSPNGPFMQTTKLITADRCGLACWRSTPKSVVSDGVAKVIAAPNPAQQELFLTTFGLSVPTEFIFYDGQGRILERKKWEICGYEERLLPFQIDHLPEGTIWIRCHNGTFNQTLKIIHTH